MAPAKLQHSVLLALGLAVAGCGDKSDEDDDGEESGTGPCLDYPADTGPCLSPPEDTGPCLEAPPEDSGS